MDFVLSILIALFAFNIQPDHQNYVSLLDTVSTESLVWKMRDDSSVNCKREMIILSGKYEQYQH